MIVPITDVSPAKILLVDDNPIHLNFLEQCLKSVDKVLLRAQSGQQTLKLIEQNDDLALILLAAHMETMDGYNVALAIQQQLSQRQIPIIFITPHHEVNDDHILHSYSAGAVDYLTKPININILLRKVDIFIELHRKNNLLQQKVIECKQLANELRAHKYHLEEEIAKQIEELKTTNQRLNQEIFEHLETEQALSDAEARYRSIFENTVEGIFQSTPEGYYLSINPALYTLYGYESAEDMQDGLNNIEQQLYVKPERRKEFMYLLETHDVVVNFESQVYCKHGRIIWISENARAVRDEQGKLLYFEGTVQNITERKNAELALQETSAAYRRFVPHAFLRLLGKESIIDVNLNDCVQKDMSILFSDIRSFTRLSERMTPEQNFRFINSYLRKMGPIVRKHHGFIDKYIGDSVMALFDKSADDAVKAGITMLQGLADFNQHRKIKQREPIRIGIGINTGLMMLGTIGEDNRMEGTVISDAVNVAARIEGLTQIYGTPLLIGDQTFHQLSQPERYAIRFIDHVKVKGKREKIVIYEVFETDKEEIKQAKFATQKYFETACTLYHAGNIKEATHLFESCLRENPRDSVAQVYLQRCTNR